MDESKFEITKKICDDRKFLVWLLFPPATLLSTYKQNKENKKTNKQTQNSSKPSGFKSRNLKKQGTYTSFAYVNSFIINTHFKIKKHCQKTTTSLYKITTSSQTCKFKTEI